MKILLKGVNVVDNFDLIRKLLDFPNQYDCYYVQLLRRASDDPKINGVSDPAYHGNMHSRSIKDYFISSLDTFDEKKEEIKQLCSIFNVRAYIRLNKRNYKNLSLEVLSHIVSELKSGESFSSPFHLISSAAGLSRVGNQTWIVDVDEEFIPYLNDILNFIQKCRPFDKYEFKYDIIPTKHGKHIIIRPFDLQTFYHEMSTSFPLLKNIDVHKDNPTILYCP